MYRQRCWLVSLVFVLGLALATVAQGADPDLVGWWWFDEGGGTTASDSSMYGNHGTLMSDTHWVPGIFGTALAFDGVDDYVEVPHDPILTVDNEVAVMAWINTERHQGPNGETWQGILSKSNDPRSYSFYTEASGTLHFSAAGFGPLSTPGVPLNEWAHVCAMVIGGEVAFYINGEAAGLSGSGVILPGAADTATFVIGRTNEGAGRSFLGMIDDVRVYRRGLTQEEVQEIMTGSDLFTTAASNPMPGDAETDVQRDAVLSWTAGESAATHDVYFGTAADDVNDASRANPMGLLVSQGQTATTYDPEGLLEIGQTYYWRIDEVNAAPDNTIFKGAVWSFTAELFAYPVANIVATSNAIYEATAGPENTVDSSGLNADDQHSTEAMDMFLGVPGADPIYLQYEFDQIYKLHEMLLWNYNVQFEMLLGFGLKDVTVEYSADGVDWIALGDVELARATARSDYAANTTIDFGGVAVKFVKLTVNSGWGTIGQFGLSEVRFLHIPASAREPQPADAAADVSVSTALAWRAGRDALSHEVYFGTDAEALALLDTVDQSGYTLDALDLGTTYYWQITEIQEAESWAGAVWSFSTQTYLVVEDFESYDDDIDGGTAIFQSWIDGWENDTGSTVGHLNDPFAEQTIVHGGRQSMPLFYDNAGLTTAEAEFALAQNWTASGIRSLSVYFYGAAGNTGQLYVKINNTRVDYDGDAADLARAIWQPWNIDLSAVGGNLSNVTKLTIGVEGVGAAGVVYIDDVRLYPSAPEYVTPIEPDTAGLVAHYAFDGNANDSSGSGFNGTVNGAPAYSAGVDGQAIELDGVADHVVVDSVGISGAAARTIAGWAKADTTTITEWTDVFGFTGPATNGQHFDIEAVGSTGTTTLGYYGLHRHGWEQDILPIDLEWHHLAATFDGTTVSWYGDGMPIGSEDVTNVNTPGPFHVGKRQDNENFFPGAVDEVRVYDLALSDGEIAWLAGRTQPVHKPF